MPAPVSAPHPNLKATSTKPRAQPHSSRKTRVIKRRGRANGHFESDEEIEREVGTDSESGEDDQSSIDSTSESESEPASEDALFNGHSRLHTPNTTQSSGDVALHRPNAKPPAGVPTPFFGTAGNWSEMVADENANGPADLPVIDFAAFEAPALERRSSTGPPRKPRQRTRRPIARASSDPAPQEIEPAAETIAVEETLNGSAEDQPAASSSSPLQQPLTRRPPGQSARQAYQQRLEADPSYVPTVGEFWGHDDRLLDKDLRSLSGWWRGRWQGRGRGRGGFMRGRGRGSFGTTSDPRPQQDTPSTQQDDEKAADLPRDPRERVDQPWTHDGFEEMKRKEELRRSEQQQMSRPTRGSFAARGGRGNFTLARGRGTFSRGGFTSSPRQRPTSALPPTGRTWFAMKPERVWTKQHEAFLYFDSYTKPRPGQAPSYRVKLSTSGSRVVRGSPTHMKRRRAGLESSTYTTSEDGDRTFVVRIPKAGKGKAGVLPPPAESVTTVGELPIDDIFTVRPGLVPRMPVLDPQPPPPVVIVKAPVVSQPPLLPAEPSNPSTAPVPSPPSISPSRLVDQIFRETSTLLTQQATPEKPFEETAEESPTVFPSVASSSVMEKQSEDKQDASVNAQRAHPPAPPPLQTIFPPVPQPSPPYGSPFGYGSAMPPGIAMNQHGMHYEMSTGRAVYLPPPTMYTPQPTTHGVMTPPGLPYMHGHIHHHSTGSPDFLAPPHTPPHNGFIDPATGVPIFSFPRQSSRIEIRQPMDQDRKQMSKSYERRPSGLRQSAADFEPRSASPYGIPGYSSSEGHTHNVNGVDNRSAFANGHASPEQGMDGMVPSYTPYQQQPYYYPYPQYYDMSHAQYEMYPTDPRGSQTVYY